MTRPSSTGSRSPAPVLRRRSSAASRTRTCRRRWPKVRKRIGDLGWDIVQERLTQDKPRTLEELGQRWGVSRERVRQVELKTKHFLARYLSAFNQDEEQLETLAEADAA